MAEYSSFPNKLFNVGQFLDLKDAPENIVSAVMSVKDAIVNGDYSSAATILNSKKNELTPYLIDSSYINALDEELCVLEKCAKAPDQQLIYGFEEPEAEEYDSWIQTKEIVYVETPSQSGELVYDGTIKTAEFENYDPELLELGGVYDGTNAGDYIATFTPKESVKWADTHTSETRDVHWTIKPGAGHIDLSDYNLTLNFDDHTEDTIYYSNPTGEVFVNVDDPTVVSYTHIPQANSVLIKRVSPEGGSTIVHIGVYQNGNAGRYQADVNVVVLYDNTQYISAVPVQVNADLLKYDGSVKTPEWLGYDSNELDMEITEEIYPGTYTASFTPKRGYKWWDETKIAKDATWTIKKGTSYIIINRDPPQVILDEDFPTDEVTYTASGSAVWSENPYSSYFTMTSIASGYRFTRVSNVNYFSGNIVFHISENELYEGATASLSVTVKKKGYSGVTTPEQDGTLTYNGSEQTPVWKYYNSEQLEISNMTSGTNAGVYLAQFTPINGNKWGDNEGTETRPVFWSIDKAPGTITFLKNSVTLGGSKSYEEVSYSDNSSSITSDNVSSSNDTVATAIVVGSKIRITVGSVVSGEATISVVVPETENYSSITKTIDVAVSPGLLELPSQSETLTYNGSEQTPSWNDYNPNELTISGDTSGTNADSYVAYFTPKEGYAWRSDNTRDRKPVIWYIDAAVSDLTVEPEEVYLTTQNPYVDLVVHADTPTYQYSLTDPDNLVTLTPQSNNALRVSRNSITSQGDCSIIISIRQAGYEYVEVTVPVHVYKDTEQIDKPTCDTTSFIYNGSYQGPVWSGYDSSKMSVSGTSTAINANTYTITFTPLAGYSWSDGNAPYEVEWTIAKAEGYLNLSKVDVTLSDTNPTDYVDINSASGPIKEPLDYGNDLIVSKSGNRITITKNVDYGASSYVAVTAQESTNYKPAYQTIWVDIIGGAVIPQVPTQSGTITYDGLLHYPEWNYYGYEACLSITGGTRNAYGAGTYTVRFTPTSGNVWWDGTNSYKTATWKINKAASYIDYSTHDAITLHGNGATKEITVYVTGSSGAVTMTSSNTSYLTVTDLGSNTFRLKTTANTNSTVIVTTTVAADDNYASESDSITITLTKSTEIYGAEWSGGTSSSWIRTDEAADFSDPTSSSSPFDNISPWSEVKQVTVSGAGSCVRIPKYYYKWTKSGSNMKLQISSVKFTGSHISPAHADRGDGNGERDMVYVGTYQCDTNYKSTYNSTLQKSKTRANFRTNIHALGNNIWQWDYAMYWTIMMLYLVEYATWDAQSKIGLGFMTGASYPDVSGKTDNLTRHTGSVNNHVRYRYIEDLWGNMKTYVDGIYFDGIGVYIIKNPANFSDTTGGTGIGERYKRTSSSSKSIISSYTLSLLDGYEWVLIPETAVSDKHVYTTDAFAITNTTTTTLAIGGAYGTNDATNTQYGPFSWSGTSSSNSSTSISSRLMVLP